MRYTEIIHESAVGELTHMLPSLATHNYHTIDKLMKKIAKRHKISAKNLHDLFVTKYKKTPDEWIKNKLDETELTTANIQKPLLYRRVNPSTNTSNLKEITEVYQNLFTAHYGKRVINPITETINNLLPHIYENVDLEIKDFHTQLKKLSKSSQVPIQIGSKLNVLQAILDMYSHTIILRGFKNPKTIVDIQFEHNDVKQITFDDGTIFPEKHEFSTTEWGLDLLDTFFFNNKNDLEKMITTIGLIKPESIELGTKLLTEHVISEFKEDKVSSRAVEKSHIKNKPITELYQDTNYHTIDKLMKKIAKRHKISAKNLHDLFVTKYKKTPDEWIKNKLDEVEKTKVPNLNIQQEVCKFVDWVVKKSHIKNKPIIELSQDTKEAQTNHHTGGYTVGSNKIWVYAKNRNLIDILRTVAHELIHVRQGELNMIKPNDSYPGSPIEVVADAIAGKWIKIYGKQHPHIFQ